MRMLLSPVRKLPKMGKILPLLIASFFAAMGFIVGGGLLVYSNTQHLVAMRDWMEHSQDVLANLQLKSQQLDRVESNMRLYNVSGNSAYLDSARAITAAIRVDLVQLHDLTSDNPSQARHVQELDMALLGLSAKLEGPAVSRTIPDEQLRECRDAVAVLQQEERALLKSRTQESKSSSWRSILSGVGFLVVCLLILVVLFGLLLRDALQRRASDERLAQTIEELEKRAGDSTFVTKTRDELQLCVSTRMAYDCIARQLEELLPGSQGAMLIINNSRSMVEMVASWNSPAMLLEVFDVDACCGLRLGKSRWRRPKQSEVHCTHFPGRPPEHYLCAPLAAHGETLGFAFLNFPTAEMADHALQETPLIHEMLELAAMSIGSLNLQAKLEHQSIRDSLTGLFNRHFMHEALERELSRAARRRSTVAVLMLDVDHFKQFNDTYSHQAGDAVLRDAANCFAESVRTEDIVCRYGGEEFVIILPDIEESQAFERAEHIRSNIEKLRPQFRGEFLKSITVSIGVANYPRSAEDSNSLLRLADQALYEAKHSGRNRVHSPLLV
jgi:diguanylate cyclase (GGDEF)-like protein